METFKDIIRGTGPVLVDFHATWCGPCKMMSPIVDELAKELQGKIRVLKIDIDKNPAVAQEFQIQSVPTFIIFKEGKVVWRVSGGMDKASLIREISPFIN